MESLNDRYGLPKKVQLEFVGPDHLAIVRFVARRLLEKDAAGIVEIVDAIHVKDPSMKVSVLCSDNVCSKFVAKLSSAGVDVLCGEPEK